jgi:hypothetical protein
MARTADVSRTIFEASAIFTLVATPIREQSLNGSALAGPTKGTDRIVWDRDYPDGATLENPFE